MQIISSGSDVVTVRFADVEVGDAFQKVNDPRVYVKIGNVAGNLKVNAVRLASGLTSTFKDDLEVVLRGDAAVTFNHGPDVVEDDLPF